MVDLPNIVIPVNVDDEEDEITDEVFELRRRAKGKNVEESRISPIPSPTRFYARNLSTLVSSDTEKLQELTVTHPTPSSVPVYLAEGLILERKTTKEETERLISKVILQERGRIMSGHILHVHPAQVQSSSVPEQQHQLYLAMKADPLLQKQDIAIWLALQMKFEKTQVLQSACRFFAIRTRDQDNPHDDAHPEGDNSAKRQKTSEYEAYVSGESSSGQVNVEETGPSTSGNQEQDGEFDLWTDSYASNDDEIPKLSK
ncbi:hypothetical protein Tco_0733046 [Tanacetum coccineum]